MIIGGMKMLNRIKNFFGRIICMCVGCKMDRDVSIVEEWKCTRCGYHHKKIEWPTVDVNYNHFDDAS
jgi:hypothetical protein